MGTHPIFESDFDCLTVKLGQKTAAMVRMHAPGKGISSSAIPYRRTVPSWQKQSAEEIKDVIYKLAKKGYKPSLIGVHLRDTYGVGKSHYLTGSKILRVLKSMGAAPELPEDLYFMIKRAVGMRKHLERNRKDMDGKFRLILIESRIHRLSRYYRAKGVVPPTFKYESATASALVA